MQKNISNLESQLSKKQQEFNELNQQFMEYQQQSDLIINDLESEVQELKRKNQKLNRELTQLKDKRKTYNHVIEKEMEAAKKERQQFRNKFILFEKKVIELENINENLQSELRATKAVLNQYEQKTEKAMEQLALLQMQMEETTQSNQQQIARLRSQLKQTQDELYAFHHAKHSTKGIQEEEKMINTKGTEQSASTNYIKMPQSKHKRNPLFAETLAEIRNYISTISERRQEISNKIMKITT